MNNTEAIIDIRRRLRRIEAQLGAIQRISIVTAEYLTGKSPGSWLTERESKIIYGRDDTD